MIHLIHTPDVTRDFTAQSFITHAQAKRNNTGAVMYTFENWSNGGKDAAGSNIK